MRDHDLYAQLLGIQEPWYVRDVEVRLDVGVIEIALRLRRSKLADL